MVGSKFRNLDGVRGLAALVVVFGHFANAFFPMITGASPSPHSHYDTWFAGTPLFLPFAANFSVCIFFVLSGFVLSAGFFRNKSIDRLTSSAVRRYFRLMFPALASVLFAFAILAVGGFKNEAAVNFTGSHAWLASLWNFPANFGDALYQGTYGAFFTGETTYNSSLWTMSIELFGSLFVFGFLALFGAHRRRWVVYLLLAAVAFKTYYLGFLLGVVLCDAWHTFPAQCARIRARVTWPVLAVGLFLGTWVLLPDRTTIFNKYSFGDLTPTELMVFTHIIGAACVIFSVLTLSQLTRLFETRPLQFLGRISFSLYLIHVTIIASFTSYLFNHLMQDFSYRASFLITFSASMVVIMILSTYFTRFIDQPAIKLSAFIQHALMNSSPAAFFAAVRLRVRFSPRRQPAQPLGSIPSTIPD
jgi:peptidoglycan/LPS O-acetylase OafA/YrhL